MTDKNVNQQLIKRGVGLLVFGFVVYIVLFVQCKVAGPELCYMSQQAWLYIPAMAAVPGAVVQFFSWLLLRLLVKTQHFNLLLQVVTHTAVAFVILRLWLAITGQQWLSPPSIDGDLFIVLAGAVMGGVLALWRSNPAVKRDAPQAARPLP